MEQKFDQTIRRKRKIDFRVYIEHTVATLQRARLKNTDTGKLLGNVRYGGGKRERRG